MSYLKTDRTKMSLIRKIRLLFKNISYLMEVDLSQIHKKDIPITISGADIIDKMKFITPSTSFDIKKEF